MSRHIMEADVKLNDGAFAPRLAHADDAGLDLRANEEKIIPAKGSASFDTGFCIRIPEGFYGKIESKSGLNVKHDVVSCGGVIDSGYTGSIVVKLYNFSNEDYHVYAGDKIAQLIIMPHVTLDLHLVSELGETDRGENGFGSSGR